LSGNEFDEAAHCRVRASAGYWDETAGRSRVRVTGKDRVKFFQNMTSQDVKGMAVGEAALACVLTVKAKLVGVARVFVRAEDFLLDAEEGCAAALVAHLKHYVVVNQVAFEDVSAATASIALEGPASAARLEAVRASLPDGWSAAPISVSGERGVRIYLPAGAKDAALAALALAGGGEGPVPEAVVDALRVENGLPRWGAEVDETTFPPEARLDRDAISATKGCFLGQEPIARLHFMGHLNKRLMGLVVAAEGAAPRPGWKLRSAEGREVGRVTSVSWSPALERTVALGIVRKEFHAPETRLTAFAMTAPTTTSGAGAGAAPDAPVEAAVLVRDLPLVAPTDPPPARERAAATPPKAAGGVTPGGATEGGLMLPGKGS